MILANITNMLPQHNPLAAGFLIIRSFTRFIQSLTEPFTTEDFSFTIIHNDYLLLIKNDKLFIICYLLFIFHYPLNFYHCLLFIILSSLFRIVGKLYWSTFMHFDKTKKPHHDNVYPLQNLPLMSLWPRPSPAMPPPTLSQTFRPLSSTVGVFLPLAQPSVLPPRTCRRPLAGGQSLAECDHTSHAQTFSDIRSFPGQIAFLQLLTSPPGPQTSRKRTIACLVKFDVRISGVGSVLGGNFLGSPLHPLLTSPPRFDVYEAVHWAMYVPVQKVAKLKCLF